MSIGTASLQRIAAPWFAVSGFSTPRNSIYQDFAESASGGAIGVGIVEQKLSVRDDEAVLDLMAQLGVAASSATPADHAILPSWFDRPGVPTDPIERSRLICSSIERLARFRPAVISVAPGMTGDASTSAGPRSALEPCLREIAAAAAANDVRVGVELLGRRRGSALWELPAAVDLIDTIGTSHLGITIDIFHSWPEPDLLEDIARFGPYIAAVQVCDVKVEERSGYDRELPGRGRGVAGPIIAALIAAGYRGYWELEVLSDDGSYLEQLPDSYWTMPHLELIRAARAAFHSVYCSALADLNSRTSVTGADGLH